MQIGDVITKVTPQPDGTFRISGQKYYSTGSIFADWIDTYAERTDTGERVIAIVDAHQPGVTHADDWDGFGQRTTGSGTSTFTDAVVAADAVIPFDDRFKYQTAYYQAVLLTVLAGSVLAAEREVALQVRNRNRVFSHGNADTFAADPQILQVVGEVSAAGFAASAIVDRAAEALQPRTRAPPSTRPRTSAGTTARSSRPRRRRSRSRPSRPPRRPTSSTRSPRRA